jgi:hypothetical protein
LSSTDKLAVWLIRSRQLRSIFKYWISITGYDSRDRSLLSRIYLLYLIVFFCAWTLSLMFFASNLLVTVVSPFLQSQDLTLEGFAVALGTYTLFAWSLFSIYKATYRSPLLFSEDDSYLVCQTPANRRAVVLFWLIGEWLRSSWPVMVLGMTVGFAFLELDIRIGSGLISVGSLAIAGIKPLGILIPVHLALFCIVWAVGVFRLQRDFKHKRVILVVRGIAAILAVLLSISIFATFLALPVNNALHTFFWYVSFPLNAAFRGGDLMQGQAVSILLVIFSITLLLMASENTNLSRAAQETRALYAQRLAFRTGDFESRQELLNRDRIGTGHRYRRILARPGAWAILWKELVQSLSLFTFMRSWSWISVLLLSLAMFIAYDSPMGVMMAIFWTILVAQLTTDRFRDDLGHWWIVKSLPLPARRFISFNIALPISRIVATTWVALWIANTFRPDISPVFFWIAPFVVVGVCLSAIVDMLRQSTATSLLALRKPSFGLVSIVLGIFCIALPSALNVLIVNAGFPVLASVLGSILVGIILIAGLIWLSEVQFNQIG